MKKYFFRPHRGGLKEAMEQSKTFETMKEMIDYIVDDFNSFSVSEITFDDVTTKLYNNNPDTRIGWNYTCIVLVDGCGYAFFTDSYSENWEELYSEFIGR